MADIDAPTAVFMNKTEAPNQVEEAEIKEPESVHQLREFDPKLVKRTMLKLDLLVMPLICLMYLAASFDKSNLGNAKTLGMLDDIGGDPDGSKYAFLNSLYFIAYSPTMIPFALLGKRTSVSKVISIAALYWGIASTAFAAVKNFPGAYACRFMVGLGEAGFSPLVPFYLARWYTRNDLARRASYWLMCAPLGGFFNGLIAYGASFIHSSLESWRVLFLLEGSITVALGVLALIFLPEDIATSRWFSDEQKDFLIYRRQLERSEEVNRINWKHARGAVYRWQQLFAPLLYSCLQMSGSALSAFMPTLAQENGFKGATAQIATLGPYGSAALVMVILCHLSDKTKNRGWFVQSGFWLTILGFGIYLGAPATMHSARFAALIFAEVGHYISTPLILVWGASNCGSESRRIVNAPMTIACAHALSIGSGYLFPKTEKPRYLKGSAVCFALGALGLILCVIYQYLLWRTNKKRDEKEGVPPVDHQPDTIHDADDAWGFRYQL